MGGEVTLFTRPRRFGKTLNMSMLRSFFEIGADALLFEGLYIAKTNPFVKRYYQQMISMIRGILVLQIMR